MVCGSIDEEKCKNLKDVWDNLLKKFYNEVSLVKIYVEVFMVVNVGEDVECVIMDFLWKSWDDSLVEVYGWVIGGDV